MRLFPAVNAALNCLCALFLVAGYLQIRRGRRETHRRLMLAACGTSIAFLISYLIYHYTAKMTPFMATGWVRTLYFFILITHVVLAVAIVPLVIQTLRHGLGARYDAHRRIARWTFPLWMYVSVTGVLVYLFLYHWFPAVA